MEQKSGKPPKSPVSGKLTRGFAEKISAVEGLKLSPEMAQAFDEFDRKGMTGDRRRSAIRSQFRKKRP